MARVNLSARQELLAHCEPLRVYGKITDIFGLTIQATGPALKIGDVCHVHPSHGGEAIAVEVVGFRDSKILLMPLGDMRGVGPGSLLVPTFKPKQVRCGLDLLGRVLGSMGDPIDEGAPLTGKDFVPLASDPPPPLQRRRITEPLLTGVKAIDASITCGKGQRVGVMSGSGVGKSKLTGMIARNTSADVSVIALIGERGKEVRDFIEVDLGPDGLARSVVVVATSDEPALRRLNGAYAATAIAEWFRAQGADVLLIMDSITRFAMAQREVGLAIGEPPTTKGFPPSVYSVLPKLLERAGTSENGSITGFYAVLVEGDDFNDPIGDAVRSIVDGHVALSRDLASRGQYPPVDILESVSRSMLDVTNLEHRSLAARLRLILSTHRDAEDLVNIGAYVAGSNPEIDTALRLMPRIRSYLKQDLFEKAEFDQTLQGLESALSG